MGGFSTSDKKDDKDDKGGVQGDLYDSIFSRDEDTDEDDGDED